MTEPNVPYVRVAVALVTNERQEVLFVFNENWGAFTLPMTKPRMSRSIAEQAMNAALRAGAEALGTPVVLAHRKAKFLDIASMSGRQFKTKDYAYSVFHVVAHPDFAGRLQVRQPHFWMSPHLAIVGEYQPVSEVARTIVSRSIPDLNIPARLQHTSMLVMRRESAEWGVQYLLRWDGDWGYTLPGKRRDLADRAEVVADRVARDELGLEPGIDAVLTAASEGEVELFGASRTHRAPAFGMATRYLHSVFAVELLHEEKLCSSEPLIWASPEEIQARKTAAAHPATSSRPAHPGEISRTVFDLLDKMGSFPEPISFEEEALADSWIEEHLRREKLDESAE